MTYVEFFDTTASDNISGCLSYAPDRVIFIGNKTKLIKANIERYKRIFKDRGHDIEFISKSISRSNLGEAVKALTAIVDSDDDDYVFDITGGEEMMILALGIIYERYPEKKVQIHKFNPENGAIYDCDNDGHTIYKEAPTLSVEENIRIYGGDVVYGGVDDESKTYKWDLTPEFLHDIDLMWDICKRDVREWNVQISIFDVVNKVGSKSDDGLTLTASMEKIKQQLERNDNKYKKLSGIINLLLNKGLITAFDDSNGSSVKISFKNKQVKRCLTKAGQILEMKIYTVARGIKDKSGAPVYDDAVNGVVIDWDGKQNDESLMEVYDTENEVDVMLMHGVVPVFVSCKNGSVSSDELYKLNTVAQRFGGRYCKRVLVANAISDDADWGKYLRQRISDMGIILIEDVQDMDRETLEKELKNILSQ